MNASGSVPGCAMIQRSNDIKNGQAMKHHASYLTIMQSNMTMNAQVMYMMMMEVAWQYISEWLWKCHDR